MSYHTVLCFTVYKGDVFIGRAATFSAAIAMQGDTIYNWYR